MGSEEHTSIGKTGSEPSAASEHTNKRDKETKDHKSLRVIYTYMYIYIFIYTCIYIVPVYM